MPKTIISVEHLAKRYSIGKQSATIHEALGNLFGKNRSREWFWALEDINFEVKEGEAIGIIGKNGAGKSTLLKILSRITEPTKGRFELEGRVSSLLEVGTGFHPELTGRENIFLNGTILGMTRSEIRKKFDAIVSFAGVERFIDEPVKHYSSGMYVRLAFSVAAHLESEILIIDEVLAVGDLEFQNKCVNKMQDVATGGRTVLFVSHNMSAVARLCAKGIFLENGSIRLMDTIDRVIDAYVSSSKHDGEFIFADDKYLKTLSIRQEGESIVLKCRYKSDILLKIPCLGFVVSDAAGNPIFGTNPLYQPPDRPFEESREGEITVRIRYPKLLNGIYGLSVWFGDGRTDYSVHRNILTFEVTNMVRYQKETYASASGPVSPTVSWEFNYLN